MAYIRNAEQAKRAEKVISLLEEKVKRGVATPEEQERYRLGVMDLCIWDWGTESYQNYIPNQIAAAEARKRERQEAKQHRIIAKALPSPPKPEAEVIPIPQRPQLKRREGRFAV